MESFSLYPASTWEAMASLSGCLSRAATELGGLMKGLCPGPVAWDFRGASEVFVNQVKDGLPIGASSLKKSRNYPYCPGAPSHSWRSGQLEDL